jgi:hypothetical protein
MFFIFNDQERKKQLSFSKALREGVSELGVQWCEGTCTGSIRHLVRCEQISGLISHHGPPLPPLTQWFIIDETSYRWLLKTILQDKAKTQKFAAAERMDSSVRGCLYHSMIPTYLGYKKDTRFFFILSRKFFIYVFYMNELCSKHFRIKGLLFFISFNPFSHRKCTVYKLSFQFVLVLRGHKQLKWLWYEICHAVVRRKIRMIERNAKWPVKGLCGRCFIRLRPPTLPMTPFSTPLTHCIRVHTIKYTYSHRVRRRGGRES